MYTRMRIKKHFENSFDNVCIKETIFFTFVAVYGFVSLFQVFQN